MKNLIVKIVFLLSISFSALSQENAGVKLIGKVRNDTILLRWAPTEALEWQYGNKHGYIVERYTITRNNTLLPKPEKAVLTSQPLKPAPLQQWEKDAEINDYSAIAAEAIFSSSFDLSLPSKGVYDVVSKTQELEQRFSFSLFAADHSFKTAKLSGLAFEDVNVKKNEKYLYRVFILTTDRSVKIDTGICYIGLRDTVSMPPPTDVRAEFKDRVVKITWPKAFLQNGYSSFVIERAEERDKNFKRVNKAAFINFDQANENNFQFVDSLPSNGVRYSFRVRGITPFGELGPPSDEVSGAGFKNVEATARIINVNEISPGRLEVSWDISGELSTVKSVSLERAQRADGKYSRVNKDEIDLQKTNYVDPAPHPTAYYRVKLSGEQDSVYSFPYLAQLLDSIPPVPPAGLQGSIDTLGITTLTWASNKEPDLLGYRVFRSNFLNAEFSQITKDPVENQRFTDTLELKTMTRSVYYKIVAIDKRFNPSAYSQVLKLEKPDVLSPAPPVLKSVIQKKDRIEISWISSPSEDVAENVLMKKSKGSQTWDQIKELPKDSTRYHYPVADQKGEIEYTIIAIDKAGNKSSLSPPFIIRISSALEKKSPDQLTYHVDRKAKTIRLSWKKNEDGITKYLIYRAIEEDPITLYKSVLGTSENFLDENLTMNKTYKYRLKAVFQDGSESSFSKEINIKY